MKWARDREYDIEMGVVVHTFNPSVWEAETGDLWSKDNLVHMVSSRSVRAM